MVEFEFWWLLVIPFFFGLGWFAARIGIKQKSPTNLVGLF